MRIDHSLFLLRMHFVLGIILKIIYSSICKKSTKWMFCQLLQSYKFCQGKLQLILDQLDPGQPKGVSLKDSCQIQSDIYIYFYNILDCDQ